jgi:hypothetical protein
LETDHSSLKPDAPLFGGPDARRLDVKLVACDVIALEVLVGPPVCASTVSDDGFGEELVLIALKRKEVVEGARWRPGIAPTW